MGVMKGDTRSLDYSSCRVQGLGLRVQGLGLRLRAKGLGYIS